MDILTQPYMTRVDCIGGDRPVIGFSLGFDCVFSVMITLDHTVMKMLKMDHKILIILYQIAICIVITCLKNIEFTCQSIVQKRILVFNFEKL